MRLALLIEVHLQSTGAPWEWQVRLALNTRMPPGAPGIPRAHLPRCVYKMKPTTSSWRLAYKKALF
jgi:hypothetical protein